MRSKYFVIPNNKKYKKVSEVNFLFPLKGFNVGKPWLFTIDELPIDSYIYINRLLDEEGVTKLDSILANNIDKIKGIFFEDLGVLELIKEKKYLNFYLIKNQDKYFFPLYPFLLKFQDIRVIHAN